MAATASAGRRDSDRGRRRLVVVEQLGREVVAAQIAVHDIDDAKGSVAQLPQLAVPALEVNDLAAFVFVDLEPERIVGGFHRTDLVIWPTNPS